MPVPDSPKPQVETDLFGEPVKAESPTIRLSVTNDGMPSKQSRYPQAFREPDSPTIGLSGTTMTGRTPHRAEISLGKEAPTVRLAHDGRAQGNNNLLGQRGIAPLPDQSLPAILISYVYLKGFLDNQPRYRYRDWVLDSGAFSAHNSGVEIKLQDYIDCSKRLTDQDPTLTEVFGLDIIGDWKSSVKNVEEMWRQGVEAIPTFHYGSPWEVLKGLCKDYPKVAIGGCVGKRDKDRFAQQCFSRVWPHKLHGLGFGSETSIMLVPWHSVDATSWELGCCKFGRWMAFGGQTVSVRGSKQNLRPEIEWYLELERRARERWKKEMHLLESKTQAPSARLAVKPNVRAGEPNGGVRL